MKSAIYKNKILIVGLGYVGTTLLGAIKLKAKNSLIVGFDRSKDLIKKIRKNKFVTYEKNLIKIFKKNNSNKCEFDYNLEKYKDFDYIIICVGTPIEKNKKFKKHNIYDVINSIKKFLKKDTLLIIRSSVKVGTTNEIVNYLSKNNITCLVAFCPERTIEGNAIREIMILPQLIGTTNPKAKKKASNLFSFLTKKIIHFNNFKEPEFIKLMDNTYRDNHFSFSNQMALLADELKLSIKNIITKANHNFSRNNIPLPGPVGGPCLSKDPYILFNSSNYKNKLIVHSRRINNLYVKKFTNKIIKKIQTKKKIINKISLIGLTFKGKPDTNDIRDSTALIILNSIRKKFPKIKIYIYDKFVEAKVIKKLGFYPLKKKKEVFEKFKLCIIHGNNKYIQDINLKAIINYVKNGSYIFDIWNNFNYKKNKINSKHVSGIAI